MKTAIAILTMTIFVAACSSGSGTKTEEKPLMDQIMDVHDAVMPKMGELMKTSKSLKEAADSLTSSNPARADSLRMLAEEIDAANESMMVWMRNFDPDYTGTEEEIKAYLMEKKAGIEKVAESMNTSVTEGKMALQ